MTFVPYVEALAFWGRAVQNGAVPRAYAAGVLLGHPLITDHTPGSAQQKADLVAADLDAWEDRVVEMVWDPEADVSAQLRHCGRQPQAEPDRSAGPAGGGADRPGPQRTSG